jgi:hypothetical protein
MRAIPPDLTDDERSRLRPSLTVAVVPGEALP